MKNIKVGLITFHDTNNFGSYLQTYGLSRAIEDLGYECEIIDYQCESIVTREIPKPFLFTLNPKQIIIELLFNIRKRTKYKKLKQFLQDNASVKFRCDRSNIAEINAHYDKFVVGSDIVWGLDITKNDLTYFLDFVQNREKKIAFSSSIGNKWSESERIILKPYLEDFSNIAVREDEAAEWISEIIEKRPEVVCDPTMLIDVATWKSFVSDKYSSHNYVLVYFTTRESINDALRYAKRLSLPVYVINYSLPIRGVKNVRPDNMSDFLSLINNASFIFTGSYHGFLFSIYFNKQFAYYNRAHKSRMNTLASRFGVEGHDGALYDVLKMEPIDYSLVNKDLEIYRKKSIDVLESFLK